MLGWAVLPLLLLVVAAVVASSASSGSGRSSALARLDERLARGELTVEQHAERVAVLGDRRRRTRWMPVVLASAVLVAIAVGGWAAGRPATGWWGAHDGMMAGHMGRSTSFGDAEGPVAGAPEVEVTATDLAFAPDVVEIEAGEPVNLVLRNDGRVFHDLSIPELDYTLAADPGERTTGSVTVEEPGTYEFLCSVPGHAQAGMRGTLRVVEGSP